VQRQTGTTHWKITQLKMGRERGKNISKNLAKKGLTVFLVINKLTVFPLKMCALSKGKVFNG